MTKAKQYPESQGRGSRPLRRKVYRVRYVITLNGQTHSAFAHLIFRDSEPLAVLAWKDPDTREQPLIAVPLNPADLVQSEEENVDFVYGCPLD